MIITKTPFRMSFFGGGTDMENFFRENGGAVLSTTFDKYCYVNVRHLPRFFDYSRELPFKVMIYGEGPQKDLIEKKINLSNVKNKIQLKGYVKHEDVRKIYEKADIFVVPSLRESGGSVFIEAMACALPVVSLDMALSRILKENQCGLFVNTEQSKNEIISEFANDIEKLVVDEKLLK